MYRYIYIYIYISNAEQQFYSSSNRLLHMPTLKSEKKKFNKIKIIHYANSHTPL